MKKKGRWLVAVLFLVIFLLIGCTPRGAVETERDVEAVHTGTKGLAMAFTKGFPPDRMYDQSTLDVLVELKNEGTADLTAADCMLYISGYDETILAFNVKDQPCGNMDGKSIFNPEGGIETAEFRADKVWLPTGVDSYSPNLLITACYNYETVATPVVCIDPNLYTITPVQRACNVQDVTLSGGQGAPVSVDRIDIDMMKNNVLFKIHVSNKGGVATPTRTSFFQRESTTGRAGIVLDEGVSIVNRCPYNLDYDDYNILSYEVQSDALGYGECTPQVYDTNKVRLVDNKATIYCKFDTGRIQTATQIPLTIRLYYSYMDYISKEVEIIRTP